MRDRFNRDIDYLRLSITDKCNLRCVYCMEDKEQDFLKNSHLMTNEEIIRVVKASAKLGIKKIRLTGGEPLARPKVDELIKQLNDIEGIDEIYMTTNGTLMADQVHLFAKYGLKGVNISLDTLKEDRFKQITRRGNLSDVLQFIEECLKYQLKVKINTVLMEGVNDDEILDFVNLTLTHPIDVRFIELMPIGIGKKHKGVSNAKILDLIKSNHLEIKESGRVKKGGPAEYIQVANAVGRVGFISAVSNCFCQDCNRIRITADGFLKQCLHFRFGVNLKDKLREGISDEALVQLISQNIYEKPEKHLFNQKDKNEERKLMNQIGG